MTHAPDSDRHPQPNTLPDHYAVPSEVGPDAVAKRQAAYGETIVVRRATKHAVPEAAMVLRGGKAMPLPAWPQGSAVEPGDRLVIAVPATDDARRRYVDWLASLQLPQSCSVAPCSPDDGALHTLWCLAAARLCLPAAVRIEARHDLLGIRLAQLALAMGADTLSGPIDEDRVLPLAGVPRPTESTRDGLLALVRHAGLSPQWTPDPANNPQPETPQTDPQTDPQTEQARP